MSKIKLAVVGGGQMGRALVGGMLAHGVTSPEQLKLVEPNDESVAWWKEHYPTIECGDLATCVGASDVILLAVKPNVIPAVAKQKARFWNGKLVISIAAGIQLSQLSSWVGHQRTVRVMPNTPSQVGAGASAFCCDDEVSPEDKATIQAMLSSVGLAVAVDENQMDGVTGLSGSGPAYICLMVEALADGGVMAGLPRPLAMQLATQTVLGTAKMIADTQHHPGQLKDAVASPGGTTIAAIATLERNGVRGALIDAVVASANRSRELRNE